MNIMGSENVKINKDSPLQKHTPVTQKPVESQSPHSPLVNHQRSLGNYAYGRMFQAKLKIGEPGDNYEQEADRVAEQVMRMSEPMISRQTEGKEELVQIKPVRKQITPIVQRQAAEPEEEEEEELIQAKPLAEQVKSIIQRQYELEEEEEEEPVQTKPNDSGAAEISPDIASSIDSLRGGGQPLSQAERSFFEPRFGHDFSHVRVHTDERAAETARSLNARAYTSGRDIVFGSGENITGCFGGRKLLAHELTHVLQQSGAGETSTAVHEIPEHSDRQAIALSSREETFPEGHDEAMTSDLAGEMQPSAAPGDLDDEEPVPSGESAPPFKGPGEFAVQTILRPVQEPVTTLDSEASEAGDAQPAHDRVAPSSRPNVNNRAGANTCTPDVAGTVLTWNVVSADVNNWKVSVARLRLTGQINIRPWPSRPNRMVVPNTANPVDGGNIKNRVGSDNRWRAAIDDMADYDTAGVGGAGPNWHSTAVSRAHEWAHWNRDYVRDAVGSAIGGNWAQTNTDLDALREPKASSASRADARTFLLPRVNTRLATWRAATVARWNSIISSTDFPGGGGRGYAAGMTVLNRIIARVRTYVRSKGWR